VRRRSLLGLVVVAVLLLAALMPAAALAEGSGQGQQGVRTASTGGLEVESERDWCATAAPCTYDFGPAQAMYAIANAFRYDGKSFGVPDEIYGECGHAWTDAMGVRHDMYAYVDATSVSGNVWLMNSGSESNTNAMASINASGFGRAGQSPSDVGFVQIQGYGQFNNGYDPVSGNYDVPYSGTNFVVTIVGTIYHRTYYSNMNSGSWEVDSTSFGTMTCQTQAQPENSLFPPTQFQSYVYGEAEVESLLP